MPRAKRCLTSWRTDISPELLPTGADGGIAQLTEATVGRYELVDFFLYHFLRFARRRRRFCTWRKNAKFDFEYTQKELRHWLRVFLERFFANQFKRSCLPDGPKVGSVSVSPRGDWRMPSDAARVWLDAVEDELPSSCSQGAFGKPRDPGTQITRV